MATHPKISAARRFEQLKKLKFYEVIDLGLKGLEKAEKPGSPVKVDMNLYHGYKPSQNICFACLGGLATIEAFQLDMTKKKYSYFVDTYRFRDTLARLIKKRPIKSAETDEEKEIFKLIYMLEGSLNDLRLGGPEHGFRRWANKWCPKNIMLQLNELTSAWCPYKDDPEKAKTYYQLVRQVFKKANL